MARPTGTDTRTSNEELAMVEGKSVSNGGGPTDLRVRRDSRSTYC